MERDEKKLAEAKLMHEFKEMSIVNDDWNNVDFSNKANVSALIQEKKNLRDLLDILRENLPAGHSENYIYEWTKALSFCNHTDIVENLKNAAVCFHDKAYCFSFMMSMMKNIPLSLDECQNIMSPVFGAEYVKNCFENRDLIFNVYNHFYKDLYRHYLSEDYSNHYQANFLDEFTEKLKNIASDSKFAGDSDYDCISKSLEINETDFRHEAMCLYEDMLKNHDINTRKNYRSNDFIRKNFPEIIEKITTPPFGVIVQQSLKKMNNYFRAHDVLDKDAQEKGRFYDGRLKEDIANVGMCTSDEVIKLANIFWQLNDRPEIYGSCYNNFYIQERNAKLLQKCKGVEDWMLPIIMTVPQEIIGDMPGSPKNLFDACKAWKISKNIWKKEAIMIGKMPLKARIVAGAIIDNMRKDFETSTKNSNEYQVVISYKKDDYINKQWSSNKNLRSEFWEKMSQAQQMGWDKAFELYCSDDNYARIHLLAQKGRHASPEEFAYIKSNIDIDKLFNSNIFSAQQRVMNVLVSTSAQEAGISQEKAQSFRKPDASKAIKEYMNSNRDWLIPASFKGAAIFKEYFPAYIKTIQIHNQKNPEDKLSIHDAVYWLPEPMNKEANARFSRFIQRNIIYQNAEHKNVHRPLNELNIIAKNWKALENKLQDRGENTDIAKLKYNDILSICMSVKYKDQRNDAFAVEAAKHGTPEGDYHNCEDIYLAGLKVPEPFDSKKEFKEGKYVGRFLPRDDPRTIFFGDYTDCCQHYGGAGHSCAVSTVKDPFSQLFVIEDGQGKIIAGSWTWENTEGKHREVCFDNIESLGELSERPELNKIYEQVGDYLTKEQNCRRVTIGLGYQDADVSGYKETEAVKLPKLYGDSYSDAHSQVLLSENPNAEPLDKSQESQRYIRDVCFLDMEAMDKVSEAVFPDGDKQLQAPENMAGFVVEDREKGVVGYCLYDREEKSIYDMAVLPEYRKDKNASSRKLFAEMMRVINKEGGEWSAEMRDETTLRYLKAMAERGYVKYKEHGVDHVMSDGTKVVAVTFSPIPEKTRQAMSRLKKEKDETSKETEPEVTKNSAHQEKTQNQTGFLKNILNKVLSNSVIDDKS